MRIAGLFLQNISVDARLDPDPEEPLGIEYVLAAAAQRGNDVKVFSPLDAPLTDLSDLISNFYPDVLAISIYTPHVPSMLAIASEIHNACPNVVVVVGGPHATAKPDIVLSPEVDIAVIGEGEATFCELLKALEYDEDLRNVAGIAFLEGSQVIKTSPRKRIRDLDLLPYPLYERRYYSLPAKSISFPPMSQVVYAPMLFSRGCNMPCYFCSSRKLWGGEVFTRSPNNVVSEMHHLRNMYGVNFIYFEDLTFTLKRKKFTALCKLIAEEKSGIHWGCETHVNVVSADDLTLMRNSGCTKILWGVESLSDSTLSRINKQQNCIDVKTSLAAAADCGILNWGCYIIGFPWENEKDILKAAEDLPSLNIHQLRLTIATPFPGSEWFAKLPNSALNPDFSLYDTNHLVYDHPTISPERMKELQNEIFVHFYRSSMYRNNVARMIKKFPHLRESFDEFLAYIDSQIKNILSGEKEITEILKPLATS